MSTKEERDALLQALAESQAKNESLQKELMWYKQSFDHMPMGSLMQRFEDDINIESLRILAANKILRQQMPEKGDFSGRLYTDALAEWVESELPQVIMKVAASGETIALPAFPSPNDEGGTSYTSMVFYPWGDSGVTVLYQDVTTQVLADQELKQKMDTIEAQQHAIQELSNPIIPVMDKIIVVPLVGNIDSARAKALMRALLAGISAYRARVVILDITGVPFVDTGVVNHLDKTLMATHLKGAKTIITGISDVVAETIVDLGIDWHQTQTLRDLQTGLMVAFKSVGLQVQRS